MRRLVVILWDHLNLDIASLQTADRSQDLIYFAETRSECTYIKHHKLKLIFLLSSMRHFAAQLKQQHYHVHYSKLEDNQTCEALEDDIYRVAIAHDIDEVVVAWPGEYRLLTKLNALNEKIKVTLLDNNLFLCSSEQFQAWAQNYSQLRMEFFYRQLRQQYRILMHNQQPEGGKWNYDSDNRSFPKPLPKFPPRYSHQPDAITREVSQLVTEHFPEHMGNNELFSYAVTRQEALKALALFIQQRLPYFGAYQDVMINNQAWLYHSHLSFYLNNGLLTPLECIKAAEAAYYHQQAPLNAVEGFIRQILGWREYVRGIYWLKMPEYKQKNFFAAERKLPAFYWHGQTEMQCLQQCVNNTIDNAYAHHIQRLMVLGNFALLTGINPDEVNEWYLIVYADAHEWVELPNVTGMILFADGGYMASKPYIAGGAYIHKMSNYCENCHYSVKEKAGTSACPFNYLYWYFLIKHKKKLESNPRLAMPYRTLAKMSNEKRQQILSDAKRFLTQLDNLPSDY